MKMQKKEKKPYLTLRITHIILMTILCADIVFLLVGTIKKWDTQKLIIIFLGVLIMLVLFVGIDILFQFL